MVEIINSQIRVLATSIKIHEESQEKYSYTRKLKYHLSSICVISEKKKDAFLYRRFTRIPFLTFCRFFCHRNQLVPRSLLRFEVPRSANKAAICRVGCCVAVCHVPRRHEIAFRSKRAKMAREERITCMCPPVHVHVREA